MAEDIINKIPKEILLKGVIAQNIKSLRKKHQITQDELANLTGINRVTIARYESCQLTMSIDKLLTIAKVLEVTPNDLLDGWEILF